MATVTGFTAERMLEIEGGTVTSGAVNEAGSLILSTRAGIQIDAGTVKGGKGDPGDRGAPGIPSGSTAGRDSLFGVPFTTDEKVALANLGVSWYNVDTGWFETYRATTGSPGLTVPGVPGISKWYPIDAPSWYQPDKQMTMSRAGFTWSANASWDAGTLIVDSTSGADTQFTHPMPTFCEPGSVSGSIRFKEVGIYDVYWYNKADKDPGQSGYRIIPIGGMATWPTVGSLWDIFGQGDHADGAQYWETSIYAPGIRVPSVNLEIRLTGIQAIATVNTPRVKIIKRGGAL